MGGNLIMLDILITAFKETIIMVFFSTIFSIIIGTIPGIALVVTAKGGIKENKIVFKILDAVTNVLRSLPFIILMVAIVPLTKLIVGKSYGTTAAIVPLTLAAAPFVTRIIESSLKEVDKGVIEAAKSFGATDIQIIFKVMIKEAIPSIVSGITLAIINIIGYSAMAGAIGGGGLGQMAIAYGYQRYQVDIMIATVLVLIVIVQVIQSFGNNIYKKLS